MLSEMVSRLEPETVYEGEGINVPESVGNLETVSAASESVGERDGIDKVTVEDLDTSEELVRVKLPETVLDLDSAPALIEFVRSPTETDRVVDCDTDMVS
jgi:hypothetical protein